MRTPADINRGAIPLSWGVGPSRQHKTIDQGIRDLEALPTPPGVDPAKFQAMKEHLKGVLVARKEGKQPLVQHAPSLTKDKVTVSASGHTLAKTVDLSWLEKLNGDYKNDAFVYVDDISKLAEFEGQRTDDDGPADGHRIVDGDGNPLIGSQGNPSAGIPSDLDAIGENYDASIDGYQVWRQLSQQSSWVLLTSVSRPSPPTDARPTYAHTDSISDVRVWPYRATIRYKVRAYYDGAYTDYYSDPVGIIFEGHAVSGRVTDSQSNGVGGVTMSLFANPVSTTPYAQATTAQDGRYSIPDVKDGSYYLIPSSDDYSFNPWEQSVTMSGSDVTNQDFTATSSGYTVSGQISNYYDTDLGMYDVKVVLVAPDGTQQAAYTDSSGDFSFSSVKSGAYKAYLSKLGCAFQGDVYSIVTVANANVANLTFHGWGTLDTSPWPKFRGALNNCGVALGKGPLSTPSTYKWRFLTTSASEVSASPAIGNDGAVYIGGQNGYAYAIDPSDGSQIWSYGAVGSIHSSPAVAGDETVYVGSNDGYLYALNTADGTVRWSYGTDGPIKSSPTIGADGIIYFGSDDGYVYALRPTASPDSNRVKWSYQTGSYVRSSPAIGHDGTIYVGSNNCYVYALNPSDGSLKWSYQANSILETSPAVAYSGDRSEDIVFIAETGFSSGVQYTYALHGSDGSFLWSFGTTDLGYGSFAASPAVTADCKTVYVAASGADSHLFCLNASTGSAIWTSPPTLPIYGSSSSVAIGTDGTVYLGATDGTGNPSLYAFSSDGSLLWDYAVGYGMTSSPAILPNGTQAGTLYVGCSDGYLYAFGT